MKKFVYALGFFDGVHRGHAELLRRCRELAGDALEPGAVTFLGHPDTLVLGEVSIPRESIKMVHCWPNRDSLGFSTPGWTVNIETDGKNQVLRTLTEGSPAETSAALLRELVVALGYGRNWPEG